MTPAEQYRALATECRERGDKVPAAELHTKLMYDKVAGFWEQRAKESSEAQEHWRGRR